MDFKEYWALREKRCFLTKEMILEASDTAEGELLCTLAQDLRRTRTGYNNLDLSVEFARRSLEMDLDPLHKREAYEILIDDAMLRGSPYIGILGEALDNGVIPEIRMTDSDMEFIRDNSAKVDDYRSFLQFCWSDKRKTDAYWAERTLQALESRMSKGECTWETAKHLSTLSLFDCGKDYDDRLLDIVKTLLSRGDADDPNGMTQYDIHKTLENINGKKEDELLIRSAERGYREGLSEVLCRYPNATETLKGQYVRAINETMRNGNLDFGYQFDDWWITPGNVLPEPSIDVAIECLHEQIELGKMEEDGKSARCMYAAIAKSMYAYGNPEAFGYAVRGNHSALVYSMLTDGFGTEKNEGLAKKIAEAHDARDSSLVMNILSECRLLIK